MKRCMIALLLLAVTAQGQDRSLPPQKFLPQSTPGTVTLALAEYNRLLELASRKPAQPEPAPLPSVLSQARYRLRVQEESVIGSLDIDGEVLRKGPVKVPLTKGLTILDADQTQKPLPLLHEGLTHNAIVSSPGRFSVTLSIAASLTLEAGLASFTLPVTAATSSVLNLEIPGIHADVRIEPGLITDRSTAGGRTVIEATLEPGKQAKVWWTTREMTASLTQREVRFLSDIKSLISVGDSELRVAALCDVTVIQGEPVEFKVPLPSDFELAEASGTTLDTTETQTGALVLKVREPSRRKHQFLIALERRSHENRLEAPFLGFEGAQRETGEVLVEGVGTMELTATEGGGLRRIDVREAGPISRSLARFPLQAAFRYHRRPGDLPRLALEWDQFPDNTVLSAIAERATITTLLNVEGKSLTEVTLRVRNHAQPFVRVELPQGASLLSAEVEGEKVKPVLGADGSRVPLLRAGFHPSGAYTVSFVYLSSGASFSKKGTYEIGLPGLDVPVSIMAWEVFMPDRLEVKKFAGSAIQADLLPERFDYLSAGTGDEADMIAHNIWDQPRFDIGRLQAGQIGGIVADPQGAVISGALVTAVNTQSGVTQTIRTDDEGRWIVSGIQAGPVLIRVDHHGFKSFHQEMDFEPSRPVRLGVTLEVGQISETVTVTAGRDGPAPNIRRSEERAQSARFNAPSQNVFNLQRRVAGILPVRVDVPRAGKSYRFIRPLVLEEETKITFQYRLR